MKQGNHALLGTMNVKKLLLKLSVPATLGMIVNALYNFVDTLFVARGVGEIAIGGLALAFPIQMIAMAFALMIGMGAASVFSRAYGRHDAVAMKKTVNTALRAGVLTGAAMSLIGILFLDELLVLFGATQSNVAYAKDYLIVILIGLIPLTLTMILNNLTRAEGRAEIAMVSMFIGTGLNIVLDPIFIFDWGLGLGVKGAAIATVISQVAAFVFILAASTSKKSALNIGFRPLFAMDTKLLWDSIVIGVPSFLRNAIGAFLAILVYNLINRYAPGDPAIYISIYGVINRVMTFVFMPGFGVIQGLQPIVGYNFGAKNDKRLREAILFATAIVAVYFVLGFLFVQLFAEAIFRLFSQDGEGAFLLYGAKAFRVVAIGFLVVAFQIVSSAVYQSVGYPLRAMVVALSRQILFFIPLAYWFSSIYGMEGIWWSFAAADLLAGALGFALLWMELRNIRKRILNDDVRSLNIDAQPAIDIAG
jgi:putative MATE family efflux protein